MITAYDIALWLGYIFGGAAALLIVYTLGRRLLARILVSRLQRRVRDIEAIIQRHRSTHYAEMDRLLFQLGEVADIAAVEAALDSHLERSARAERKALKKLYSALGLVQRYLGRLRSAPRWTDRAQAAHALGRLGAVEAIPALVDALRDPHEDAHGVKLAAAQALTEMRAVEAVPLLLEQLSERDEWASPRIAEILVGFGERALPHLVESLDAEAHANLRVWAAQIIGRIGHPSAVSALLVHVRDRSQHVRMSVAEALGHLRDRRAVDDLVGVALNDPVAAVRAEAARALGRIGDPAVLRQLVELLGDPDYWTRLRAIEAIEAIRPDDVSALDAALRDPSAEVRSRAAVALERLGTLRARVEALKSDERADVDRARRTLVEMGRAGLVESILSFLEHPDFRVRARVADALGDIGELRAIDSLVALLDDDMWPVRTRAVEAIEKLRAPGAVRLLLPALSDPEETVRAAVASAIRVLGPQEDRATLSRLLAIFDTDNAAVRCSVVEAVGHVERGAVERILKRALVDPNADVRIRAVGAIGERRARAKWLDALVAALADPNTRVRAAAAHGLARLGSAQALSSLLDHVDTVDRTFREAITDALATFSVEVAADLVDPSATLETTLAAVWTLGKTGEAAAVEVLRPLAGHGEAPVRAAVAGALAKLSPHPDVESTLASLLSDRNERVRAAAVNAIGRIGAVAQGPRLLERLDDPDAFVRNRAAISLGLLGGDPAADRLEAIAAAGDDPAARAFAVVGLALAGRLRSAVAALGDPELRREVAQVIRREPDSVQDRFGRVLQLDESSSRGLGGLEPEALGLHYVETLKNHQDPAQRAAAVEAIGALETGHYAELLIDAIKTDPDATVRRLAVEALGAAGRDDLEVTQALADALRDPSPEIPVTAARALERCPDRRHNRALLRCFTRRRDDLDAAAANALAAANADAPADFVDELMGHRDEAILSGGAVVLGRIGDPKATPLLTSWLRSGSPPLRAAATRALGAMGTVEAKARVMEALSDPAEPVRLSALEALAHFPGADMVDAAKDLRRDPSVEVRTALARLLGASRQTAAVPMMAALSRDPAEPVRTEAMIALLSFGDGDAVEQFNDLFQEQPTTVQAQLRALGGDHPAVAALAQLARDSRRRSARVAAIQALGRLGWGTLERLTDALHDPAAAVRVAAVEVLAWRDDPDVEAALDGMLEDPHPKVRDAVRRRRLTVMSDEEST